VIHEYESKRVAFLPPQSLASNTSGSSATIDTKGYSFAKVVVDIGVTNIALATLKVQQSDLSNMGGATDISGTNFGADNNDAGSTSSLPDANTSNTSVAIFIDLRGKKRYIKVVATTEVNVNHAGLYSAYAELSRPAETPRTAAEAGYGTRMIG
jgi:hypothetical protein